MKSPIRGQSHCGFGMTVRERFHRIVNFERPDRYLAVEWAPWWTETLDAWQKQGLNAELVRAAKADPVVLQKYFDLDPMVQEWVHPFGAGCPAPGGHGAPLLRSEEEYERFVRNRWLYPEVEALEFPMFDRYGGAGERDGGIFWLTLNGFFWHPRTLFGIEGHLFSFFDQPELMMRMNQDATEYYRRVIERVTKRHEIDFVTFAEDLSYNHGPMLSREQFDEFIAPFYRELFPLLRDRGIRIFIDTDGNIDQCVEWFMENGADGILPLERMAGVDVPGLRRRYPKLLMTGGFDKTVMHCGEAALRREFERLMPVVRTGGYLLSCDHQTPPAVTLEDYALYRRLLREYGGVPQTAGAEA